MRRSVRAVVDFDAAPTSMIQYTFITFWLFFLVVYDIRK